MKRSIAFCILTMVLFSILFPFTEAHANEIQPRWDVTRAIVADLQISASGIATCRGQVSAYDNVPVKVVVHLKQQKNGSWGTLKTWSVTDTTTATCQRIYAVESGYTYKVVATGYVYDLNGNIVEVVSATKTVVY
jgi:hypothetical protein